MLRSSDNGAERGLRVCEISCERGGKPLFGPLDMAVEPGTAMFVVGPNGSGKSTLLRALAGLTEALTGSATWNGETGNLRGAAWRTRLTYAGHKSGHKDDLSVAENLDVACALEGIAADSGQRGQALTRVGLARRSALPVKRLSQGQKQRLTLARLSLSVRPLWLLDEPSAALDTDARGLLADILGAHLSRGGAALVATHERIDLPGQRTTELALG